MPNKRQAVASTSFMNISGVAIKHSDLGKSNIMVPDRSETGNKARARNSSSNDKYRLVREKMAGRWSGRHRFELNSDIYGVEGEMNIIGSSVGEASQTRTASGTKV
jgi:hypothetical protein